MGPTSREGPALALNARHARAVNRACPVLSSSPACIVLVFIRPVAYSRYRSRDASETPRARLLACASPGLLARVSSSTTGNQTTLIITTLPIVLIQLPPPPNPLITRFARLYIPPVATRGGHGMEERCTYQSPASCLVPVKLSDTILHAGCTSPAAGSLAPAQAITVERGPSQRLSLLRLLLAGCLIPPADPD